MPAALAIASATDNSAAFGYKLTRFEDVTNQLDELPTMEHTRDMSATGYGITGPALTRYVNVLRVHFLFSLVCRGDFSSAKAYLFDQDSKERSSLVDKAPTPTPGRLPKLWSGG